VLIIYTQGNLKLAAHLKLWNLFVLMMNIKFSELSCIQIQWNLSSLFLKRDRQKKKKD